MHMMDTKDIILTMALSLHNHGYVIIQISYFIDTFCYEEPPSQFHEKFPEY